jgi:hypothetical protein
MNRISSLALVVALALACASCSSSETTNTNTNLASSSAPSPSPQVTFFPMVNKDKEQALKTQSSSSPQPSSQSLSPEESVIRQNILAALASKITYRQITKNADSYQAQPWAFFGTIIQIQESGGKTSALVALDVLHDDVMKVRANFTTNFVEKDQVYVVGYLAGNYSYISEAGWNITVPAINASAMLTLSEAARIRAGRAKK